MSYEIDKDQTIGKPPETHARCGIMVNGAQIRAARALLGWSPTELAEKAGISYSSIARAEAIDGISSMRATHLFQVQKALEDGGVIFLSAGDNRPGGDGVRLKLR